VGKELRLNEFKDLYKAWKKGIPSWLASSPWWDHLLLAVLYWVEEHYIDVKARNAVDKAIKEVVLPPMLDCVTPIYRETPSKTSTSLPEMRLTAPWYDGGAKGAEPATEASRDL
jgi:hypothetical protein